MKLHSSVFLLPLLFLLPISASDGGQDAISKEQEKAVDADNVSPEIQTSFAKLIPQFSPATSVIQLKTDERIVLDPTMPFMVPFLVQYETTARNVIQSADLGDFPPSTRDEMDTFFSVKYGNFLKEVGVPVGCLSFYAGSAAPNSLRQLETLADSLVGTGSAKTLFDLLGRETGEEIVRRLRVRPAFLEVEEKDQTAASDSEACDNILWTLKDGTVVAYLPTMDISLKKIWMPNTEKGLNILGTNATHAIEEYFYEGLNCVKDEDARRNFSSIMFQWMSVKVFPQLLRNPTCIDGFPSILRLLVTIQKYRNYLGGMGDDGQEDDYDDQFIAPLHPIDEHGSGTLEEGSGGLFFGLVVVILVFLPCICMGLLFCCCCRDPETRKKVRRQLSGLILKLKGLKKMYSSYEPVDQSDEDEEDFDCQKPRRSHKSKRNKEACCETAQISLPICPGKPVCLEVTTTDGEEISSNCVEAGTDVPELSEESCTSFDVSDKSCQYQQQPSYQQQCQCQQCCPCPRPEPPPCCPCRMDNNSFRQDSYSLPSRPRSRSRPKSLKSKSKRRNAMQLEEEGRRADRFDDAARANHKPLKSKSRWNRKRSPTPAWKRMQARNFGWDNNDNDAGEDQQPFLTAPIRESWLNTEANPIYSPPPPKASTKPKHYDAGTGTDTSYSYGPAF